MVSRALFPVTCDSTLATDAPDEWWYCTLDEDHDGDHEAHGGDNDEPAYMTWTEEEAYKE